MKKVLGILLIIVFILSCTQGSRRMVHEEYESGYHGTDFDGLTGMGTVLYDPDNLLGELHTNSPDNQPTGEWRCFTNGNNRLFFYPEDVERYKAEHPIAYKMLYENYDYPS